MDEPELVDEVGNEESELPHQRLPAKVYLVGALTQFAIGMAPGSFIESFMIDMGASLFELGAFRSVGNFAPTVLQPAWGAVSDKTGRTKAFVAFGTFTGLVMIALFLWAETPVHMIAMYGIQSLLFSIQIPTWLSLVGSMIDEENRGSELGRLGLVTNTASLIATLASGYIAGLPVVIPFLRSALGDLGLLIFPTIAAWREVYYIPFYSAALVGIIASLVSLRIREREIDEEKERHFPPIHKILAIPGNFRRFAFVSVFFSFAMSIAWPYFTVVQRTWLHGSLFEIALASSIMLISIVIFTVPFGRLSDKIGRKPLILLGRGLLFLVPLMYAFASHMFVIYAANALAGFCIASSMNARVAYIYDVAPEEERGSYLAVFSTFTGILFLCGSFVSGILGELLSIINGEYFAVFWMLIISASLRVIASFPYLLIREPREYKSTFWGELRNVFHK
ncbi:MAG: MFS transporter [Candidatus Thorarchaeota archaeon]